MVTSRSLYYYLEDGYLGLSKIEPVAFSLQYVVKYPQKYFFVFLDSVYIT